MRLIPSTTYSLPRPVWRGVGKTVANLLYCTVVQRSFGHVMKAVKRSNNARRKIYPLSNGTNSANAGSAAPNPAVTPATTISLRGVDIHFPFKPYACQEDYMGKVLDALHRSENALLESPTGTGKSKCVDLRPSVPFVGMSFFHTMISSTVFALLRSGMAKGTISITATADVC